MSSSLPSRLAAAAALVLGAGPLAAQIDYRNLDDGRPTRVTDAYPVERFAFELSVPLGYERLGGRSRYLVSPHLEYGLARNVMVGIGAEVAAHRERGEDEGSHLSVGALWNLRRETKSLPGLSLSAEVARELGDSTGRATAAGLGVLATRGIGRARIHGNAAFAAVDPELAGAGARIDWWAGLALDYTLFRTSTLLVADLVAEEEGDGEPVRWTAGAGLRRQLTPTLVLHAGAARRFGEDAGYRLNLGLSHAFALGGLIPRGPR